MPKNVKVIWKPGASKRKRVLSSRVNFTRLCPMNGRSPPISIDIPSNLVVDKLSPGLVDFDYDIVDPLEPFVVLDIHEPTQPIKSIVGRSW